MALKDQLLFGTYVGLVIESNDPDDLGRVKVFVPGQNGPLYSNWNDSDADLEFASVSNDVFPEETLMRLKRMVPWARPAMPLWGGGTGSFNETSSQEPYVIPTESAYSGMGVDGTPNFAEGISPKDLDEDVKKQLSKFAGAFPNAVITSTTGGKHKANSLHYQGRAIDIRTRDKSPAEIRAMTEWWASQGGDIELGYEAESSQPHLHIGFRTDGNRTAFAVGGTPYWWDSLKSAHKSGSLVNKQENTAPPDNRIAKSDGLNPQGNFDQSFPVGTGSTEATDKGGLAQAQNGTVNKTDVYNSVLSYIKNNPNSMYMNGKIPRNGSTYGLNGTPESWANMYANMAGYESDYNNPDYRINLKDDGGSYGLFQVGPDQLNDYTRIFPEKAKSYGLDPSKTYTKENLLESADFNTRSMLFLGEAVTSDRKYGGFAVGPGFSNGMGATIGSLTWEKLARNEPTSGGSSDPNKLVQRTTSQGVNAYGSVNIGRPGSPVGSFSIPCVGAKVWVMFEGGSPQRPIYMGQVYDPSNIRAVS
jgi:hypothetical protein